MAGKRRKKVKDAGVLLKPAPSNIDSVIQMNMAEENINL